MDTHRIELPARLGAPDGAHVVIRERLSWAKQQRIDSAGVKVTGDAQAYIDSLAKGLAVLEAAVISWEGVLDVETGRPLKADKTGYLADGFDPRVGDWLVDAIVAFYAEDDDEGKPDGSTPSSEL